MVTDIKHWLRKQPVATSVRCVCADGQVRMVRIDGKSKRRFVDAEDVIVEMRAISIEALDAKGNSIRMTELEGAADVGNVPVAANEKQSDLAHFASLLAQAYKDGAKATESPTKMAFDTLGHLIQLVLKRLDDVEARHVKQLNVAARALESAGGGGGDDAENPLMAMLGQFLMGMQGAKGLANGAAATEETSDA